MNKIILLISITGSYLGGAQKRYLSLFNFIFVKRNDYFLVVNKKLYLALKKNNVLTSFENVRVISLYGEKDLIISENLKPPIHEKPKINYKTKISKIRLYLGRKKMFLKSVIIWLSFIIEFRKILKEIKSNIVYAVWTGGIYAWPVRKIFKFKMIYSYNDSTLSMVKKDFWGIFNDSEYWALKNADKIDFLSPGIVDSYQKKIGHLDINKYTVTPNSFINYEKYFAEKPKNDDVVFLSRLWSNKNPLLFLQSVKIFNEKYPDMTGIKFYVIGEGGLEEDIQKFIVNNKLHNVFFTGKTYEPWNYLRKSKVYVSIQQADNYPSQSLIEAMACENVIIASDAGETRLLISEKEGILIPLEPESLADAVYRLFTTENMIEQMGLNSRKKVTENHTIEKYLNYFFSITDI